MDEILHNTEIVDVSANEPLITLGRVLVMPGALDLGCDFTPYLAMHQCGLWGEVGEEDWQENDLSVKEGFRVLSAYVWQSRRFWIITEWDRSATTILLPDEY